MRPASDPARARDNPNWRIRPEDVPRPAAAEVCRAEVEGDFLYLEWLRAEDFCKQRRVA